MNKKTNTNMLTRTSLILALAMASWLPTAATAEDQKTKTMKGGDNQIMHHTADTKQHVDGKMMPLNYHAMKEQKAKMMAKMKAQDAELTAQVAKMNSAPKDKKLNLMADIITKLVEQRAANHAQMAMMMQDRMIEYMQIGEEPVSTPQPMMKNMKSMD